MSPSSFLRLLLCCLTACFFLLPANAQGTAGQKPALEKYSKWGLAVAINQGLPLHRDDETANPFTALVTDCRGLHITLYHNRRLSRCFYYQPEIAYAIYNSAGNDRRTTFATLTPLHFQLGFHTGWCRPFVFAGAHIDVAVDSHDGNGNTREFPSFSDRLSWGYLYGGGIDILSFFQFSYRRRLWMYDFTSLTRTANAVDRSFCFSFFF